MELREFKEFLLLEKIEKREFTKVFADDTIRIGIEFECYIDGLHPHVTHDVMKAYQVFLADLNAYEGKIKEAGGVPSDKIPPPTVPKEYIEYLMTKHDLSYDKLEKNLQDVVYSVIFENGRFQTMMTDLDYIIYLTDTATLTKVEDLRNFDWSIFPFKDFVVGDYHDNDKNFHQWRIELDSTTGPNGVEIISPIMTLQDALPVMKTMFAFINKYGGTTKDHGMHVNISKRGVGLDNVDLLKLMLFVDEGFVWKKFPDRIGNSYARSVLDDLIQLTTANVVEINRDIKKNLEKSQDIAQVIFPAFKSKLNLPAEKFKGVNFSHLHAGDGRIEMRYLGGADYHRKYKDNVAAIGRYVYYLLLSLDPDFKKKEYAKKLLRLSSKFKVTDDKLNQKQFDKILKDGKYFGNATIKGEDLEYFTLGKFVYGITETEIVDTYSIKKWNTIKSKIKGFKGV